MDNLYDLFDRKKEACALEERFEYEDQSVIMEDIIQESNMQFIQIQADSYVNELLIEEAMYNDFDEHYIHGLMESSFSEKKDKLIKFIQDRWAKLKAWFKRVVENIKNFFSRNKSSLKTKDGKPVDNRLAIEVLRNCEKEVVNPLPSVSNITDFMDKYEKMSDDLNDVYNDHFDDKISLNDAKAKALSVLGVKDKRELRKVAHNLLWVDKPTKVKIKDLNHTDLIGMVLNEKDFLDHIYKSMDETNKEYREMLAELKSARDIKNADKKVAFLNYTWNLEGTLLSTLIGNYKKISANCRNVIKIALGTEESDNENK